MIKLSQYPPDPNTVDWNNPQNVKDWALQMYLCVDELARKAQDRQMEIRSTVPGTTEVEEGTFVAYVNGATIRIYTKQNGTIQYWVLS